MLLDLFIIFHLFIRNLVDKIEKQIEFNQNLILKVFEERDVIYLESMKFLFNFL